MLCSLAIGFNQSFGTHRVRLVEAMLAVGFSERETAQPMIRTAARAAMILAGSGMITLPAAPRQSALPSERKSADSAEAQDLTFCVDSVTGS